MTVLDNMNKMIIVTTIVTTIVGSCALYALLKLNALYAHKNQERTFNSRDQV